MRLTWLRRRTWTSLLPGPAMRARASAMAIDPVVVELQSYEVQAGKNKSLYPRIPPHTFHPSSRPVTWQKKPLTSTFPPQYGHSKLYFKKRLQLSIKEGRRGRGKLGPRSENTKGAIKMESQKSRGTTTSFSPLWQQQPFKLWPAAPLNLLQSACQSNTVCTRFKVSKSDLITS